jgi:hypothetical protein
MAELSQLLIVFNHEQGALHQDVADAAEALRAYNAAERHFAEHEHIELVLIGSDSLDTVRRTHANYFDGTDRPGTAPGGRLKPGADRSTHRPTAR